ncbi:drebrin-like protein [Ctenocephalides felis]|uniref:drebrin-like protein n=1 Tax=Ctenocephalides felis TaxID=7515 RepID=UPI000E6E4E02|nr:drebrin-like protein [Ctenocephalides felis]XP_026468201.1 drebrin-like protein [Ctenocephalides felis]
MSINLKKHQENIINAWKDVLDEKSSTDWALFGYDGQSNDLKVVSTGNGGLDELVDEMNSSKIMYAFLKVTDPQTSLHKYVFINWQGEGAPVVRKGTCAGHVGEVARLLHGAHATLHARAEEDLDHDRIIKLVATGASRYDFKAPRQEPEPCKPVTSTYKRIIPSLEINSKERNSFWQKEQENEKKRFEAEAQKKNLASQQQKIIEAKQHREEESNNVSKDKKLTPTEEAKTIIQSNRSIANSRAIFEKASTPQLQKNPAPAKPLRNSIVQRSIAALAATAEVKSNHSSEVVEENKENIKDFKESTKDIDNTFQNQPENVATNCAESADNDIKASSNDDCQNYDCNSETEDEKYSTIKRTPQSNKVIENEVVKQVDEIAALEVIGQNNEDELVYKTTDSEVYDLYNDYGDLGLKARALYDYQAADETEITFDPGDIITHIDCIDEGWWQGLAPDGAFGLFPANYVEIIQ